MLTFLRRQWSQVFASNLQQLGINAQSCLSWTGQVVYDRALTPSADMVGKTYDNKVDMTYLPSDGHLEQFLNHDKSITEETHRSLLQQDKTTIFGTMHNPTAFLINSLLQQATLTKQACLTNGKNYTMTRCLLHK
jgi:hypothetical protein